MGIDVVLYADVPRILQEEEVRHAAIRAQIAGLGLWVQPPGQYSPEGRQGLTLESRGSASRVHAHTMWRYYGEGYERGPLPEILMLARYLRHVWSDCVVHYGGDCESEHPPLDAAREEQLIQHLFSTSGRSYFERTEGGLLKCEWCGVYVSFFSFGPHGRRGGTCRSCCRYWAVEADGRVHETKSDFNVAASSREYGRSVHLPISTLLTALGDADEKTKEAVQRLIDHHERH